ncbi:para-aminobenzoate synthase [Nannizzia gypsea CBS 118893]|uniref:aminodeoxychorismate synthase n=1 Tax=Arthroderma gypseum (strain ATCC MYA-4604 / CBS 118893) TaxID=535722 RepID=E5R1F2_ARTGP|nr:para-aminobenzoate synthase [Nannizzia gypsea CBS 118893]EFQ97703.1 para-aminobenzoate synthase [Nannizzia gypsea CBS 118893]
MATETKPLRVVIIDHYDSYTNNIIQLLQNAWSVAVIRFDEFTWDAFKDSVLPNLDAIILSPGPGSPDKESDFGFNSRLIREANIPILGICLGHQGIGTAFGAKIIHAPNIKHGQVCKIHHTGTGIFEGLPKEFEGVRYNSLVLPFNGLPKELELTAWTFDEGIPVVMGIRHTNRPIYGTQWHPESVCSKYGQQIIDNFRDKVLQFWDSQPSDLSTFHHTSTTGLLPDSILSKSAIIKEAQAAFDPKSEGPCVTSADRVRPYYIQGTSLGKGVTPQAVFDTIVRNSSLDGEAWLDSARVRDAHSRNSYMGIGAFTLCYWSETGKLSVSQQGKQVMSEKLTTSYWSWLDQFQRSIIQQNVESVQPDLLGEDTQAGQPLLQVGLIGYFGYEMKRESLPGYKYTRSIEKEGSHSVPNSQHLFTNFVLRLDNYTSEWMAFGLIRRGEEDPIGEFINSHSPIGLTRDEYESILSNTRELFAAPPSPPYTLPLPLPTFEAIDDENSYSQKIRAAQDAIKEGETYEVTLTTRFRAKCLEVDPYSLYLSLRSRNPAPYSAYIHFPVSDTTILSSSPERFISVDGDGVAEMKPIKGTLAVSPDKEEDERRKVQLATDVKELAENLMIVDLIRSDLHNISPSKSIQVPKLLQVESYETVHQLVTTIQSHIAKNVGGVKVVERCFPPGSMTGAPKLRSVKIIDELEGEPERGIYSGSIGYMCASGTVDQSVVIRTIIKNGADLELGAGGAITWLSEPDKEWDEVMVKANAVAKALPRQG